MSNFTLFKGQNMMC